MRQNYGLEYRELDELYYMLSKDAEGREFDLVPLLTDTLMNKLKIDPLKYVTYIHKSMFKNLDIQSIEIPKHVRSIRAYAFYNCENLESVIIPNSVKKIGDCAFYGCISLKSIEIPNSVIEIGKEVFLCYSKNLVIKCHKDSCADIYAKENKINVEYI